MNVSEFRKKINIKSKVIVEGEEYKIKQLVRFRLDDGSFYIKLFFTDGHVLADDLDENMFIFVKEIDTDFQMPFPREVVYDGKKFKFSYKAHAVVEEVMGVGQFQVNDSEKFWDYETENGDYLSLGMDDKTDKRMDLVGKIVSNNEIKII